MSLSNRSRQRLGLGSTPLIELDSLEGQQNLIYRSIKNPSDVITSLPDLEGTRYVLKSINIVDNEVPAGDILLLFCPYSKQNPLKMFGWNPGTSRYYWVKDIQPAEELTQSFDLARFISGKIAVTSDTITGTTFTLSGLMNAIQFQTLPDMTTLSFNNLVSYKKDDVNVLGSVLVSEGIVSLADLDGEHTFRPFDTTSVTTTENLLRWITQFPTHVNSGTIASIDYTDSSWPTNLMGNFKAEVEFDFVKSDESVSMEAQIIVTYNTLHEFDYTTIVPVTISTPNQYCASENALEGHARVTLYGYAPSFIEKIEVKTQGNVATQINIQLVVETFEYYQRGITYPGTLIALQGLSEGQRVAITSVLNYEVVPDSYLSRQISTSQHYPMGDPFDLYLAKIALMINPRMLYTMSDYATYLSSNKIVLEADNNAIASNTMLPAWMKTALSFLPQVGGQLASVITGSPQVGQFVSQVGNSLLPNNETRATFGSRPMGVNRTKAVFGSSESKRQNKFNNMLFESDEVYLTQDIPDMINNMNVQHSIIENPTALSLGILNTWASPGPLFNTMALRATQATRRLPMPPIVNVAPSVVTMGSTVDVSINAMLKLIYVVESSAGLLESCINLYDMYSTEEEPSNLKVASNVTLAQDSLASIYQVWAMTGFMPTCLSIYAPNRLPITGPSISLAAYASLLQLHIPGLLTGCVGKDGTFYTPDLEYKLPIAVQLKVPLITTWDDEDFDNDLMVAQRLHTLCKEWVPLSGFKPAVSNGLFYAGAPFHPERVSLVYRLPCWLGSTVGNLMMLVRSKLVVGKPTSEFQMKLIFEGDKQEAVIAKKKKTSSRVFGLLVDSSNFAAFKELVNLLVRQHIIGPRNGKIIVEKKSVEDIASALSNYETLVSSRREHRLMNADRIWGWYDKDGVFVPVDTTPINRVFSGNTRDDIDYIKSYIAPPLNISDEHISKAIINDQAQQLASWMVSADKQRKTQAVPTSQFKFGEEGVISVAPRANTPSSLKGFIKPLNKGRKSSTFSNAEVKKLESGQTIEKPREDINITVEDLPLPTWVESDVPEITVQESIKTFTDEDYVPESLEDLEEDIFVNGFEAMEPEIFSFSGLNESAGKALTQMDTILGYGDIESIWGYIPVLEGLVRDYSVYRTSQTDKEREFVRLLQSAITNAISVAEDREQEKIREREEANRRIENTQETPTDPIQAMLAKLLQQGEVTNKNVGDLGRRLEAVESKTSRTRAPNVYGAKLN